MTDYNRKRNQQYSGIKEDRDQDRWRYNQQSDQYKGQEYDGVNYGPGNYNNRSSYGSNYENKYSQGGYGVRNRNYGSYQEDAYNRQSDYNRPYNKSGYGEDEYGAPEAFTGNRDYYGGGHGYMGGYDYRIADENRYRGFQQRPYRDANRGERNWWDRTRDEVSSWFGDDDAERRRERDHRISGSHKGKGPRGYSRSAERIKEDVCERLSEDAYVDASDIDIKMEGSEVILAGTVHSRAEKHRAEDLVESISGVTNVQNQLRVARSEYASASDVRTSDTDRL